MRSLKRDRCSITQKKQKVHDLRADVRPQKASWTYEKGIGDRGHGSSHQMIYLATLDKGVALRARSKDSPKLRESPFPLNTHRYKNGCTARRVLRPSVTMVTPQHNPEEKPWAQEVATNSSTTSRQGHAREVGVTEARDHRRSALGNRREATKRP